MHKTNKKFEVPNLTLSHEQLTNFKNHFLKELKSAQKGKETSLAFIHNELPSKPIISNDEFYQVMSIGGSNFEMGKVVKKMNHTFVTDYEKNPIRPIETKEMLMEMICENLNPETKFLGVNFAYPIKPITRGVILDGELIKGTKEHKFHGLVGKAVGLEIEKYVKAKFDRDITVSVANDTICLLLSGLHEARREELAAGIVGTGMNFALFEDNDTAINLESGNFNKFDLSESGAHVDSHSNVKGTQYLEKETAGAYLSGHYNYIIEKLNYPADPVPDTASLDQVIRDRKHPMCLLAEMIIEKSAQYIAGEIAAIKEYKNIKKMTLIMEGSVYWKAYNYRRFVDKGLETMGIDPSNVNIIHFEHSTLIGASRLM